MRTVTIITVGALLSGCTLNLTIDTDYAAQRDQGGKIEQRVATETRSETDPTVDITADIPKEL